MPKLRPYQSEACRAIVNEFNKGVKKTLLVLPTGCGKTIVFSGVGFKFAYDPDRTPTGKHVLILAHRNILIEQAAEKYQNVLGIRVSREQGTQTCKGSPYPITVSSVQTMARRCESFDTDYFALIIIDEAHHTMSAQYQTILNHFTGACVLGVTATPDRGDKKKLEAFESVAYEYTIKKAIDDGYLAPMTVVQTALRIDLKGVRKSHGDLVDADIGAAIEPYLHQIAEIVRQEAKGRRIVCFVPLIKTAKKAAEIFSHYGFTPAWTAGVDKEKDEKLNAFARGDYDIIFNSMLLTEGWDCPETDCVIVLRPTTSRGLYVQMIGRGLRLAPGKKDCLLVDFLFQNGHFRLASPKDILGTNEPEMKPDEEQEKGEGTGTSTAPDAEARLQEALERAGKRLTDPHSISRYAQALASAHIENDTLMDTGPTDAQKRKLRMYKLDPDAVTYCEAQAIIDYETAQKKPSPAMIWRLGQLGYDAERVAQMTFTDARKLLSREKARGRW